MPRGPRGESRSADVIGAAVKVVRIATGEETEKIAPVSPGAALGKLGEQARARNLTPERKAEIAKMAAGLTGKLWSMEDVVALIDTKAEASNARGTYKPRQPKAA